MKYMLLTLPVVAGVFVVVELWRALRTYLKFRGRMLVSCPETHRPTAVRVAAAKAAIQTTLGNTELRLSECSRWLERRALRTRMFAANRRGPKSLFG